GENKVVLVSPGPDGLTRFELIDRPGEPSSFAGFVPLDDSGETFIAWPEGRGGVGPSWRGYGLVRRAVGGGYIVLLPDCRRTAAIVAAAGGTVDPRGNDSGVCDLPDRASLEAAMRALATTPGDHGPVIRLEPLGA
ncbi:MAG TPA: hypothetical protein VEW04_04305, partial [Allosphingosinicella sp.]|nr:hypothetical protein [Allosphingosinicella sp.]